MSQARVLGDKDPKFHMSKLEATRFVRGTIPTYLPPLQFDIVAATVKQR